MTEDRRFIIGIDLGTTNSAVSYVDTNLEKNPSLSVKLFNVPQLVEAGRYEALPTLPSCCYLAGESESQKGDLRLPWQHAEAADLAYCVGAFALQQGSRVPTRLVQSAKSWLCHVAAKRQENILPLDAAEESQRISPVEATMRTLTHIKEAWNHSMGGGDPSCEFEQQEIVLTVPASFDEVARTLTVQAAKQAGFTSMTLLEEPQAALYSWISRQGDRWQDQFKSGDRIFVCDVGGGTTDFSLIEVKQQNVELTLQRQEVGPHLLLGGDNMDATVAHHVAERLKTEQGIAELDSIQWLQLQHQARQAKEALFGNNDNSSYSVTIQGAGSKVIGGTITIAVTRSEIENLLVEGFFGVHDWESALQLKKTEGIRAMGLPYENEPSVIKHIANFLNNAGGAPHYVLFNGGTMKSPHFQEAVLSALQRWFPDIESQSLESTSLDLAVSRGAAYFGKVRRGLGVRIGGGLPRSYYLGINVQGEEDSTQKALTLLPRGSEEGTSYRCSEQFLLQPNAPVAFELFTSHSRLNDQQGDLINIDKQEMQHLPSLQTVLRYGKGVTEAIPVVLEATYTDIGILELWLQSQKTDHRWLLEFQLRSSSGDDDTIALQQQRAADETFDTRHLNDACETIRNVFSGNKDLKPARLMERLETILNQERADWSPSILRGLWDTVLDQATACKVSSIYEARWWNLVGFILRPGYGYPLDDHRMKQLWKVILANKQEKTHPDVLLQQWICYRRLAGGFNKGQQSQLVSDIITTILNKKKNAIEIKSKTDLYPYTEKIRMLGAMELLPLQTKINLGEALTQRILSGEGDKADLWALGRIGARQLLYGSVGNVIPQEVCSQWIEKLLANPYLPQDEITPLLGQLARKTDQRELNIPQSQLRELESLYPEVDRLLNQSALTQEEQEEILGDQLPKGLTLKT